MEALRLSPGALLLAAMLLLGLAFVVGGGWRTKPRVVFVPVDVGDDSGGTGCLPLLLLGGLLLLALLGLF